MGSFYGFVNRRVSIHHPWTVIFSDSWTQSIPKECRFYRFFTWKNPNGAGPLFWLEKKSRVFLGLTFKKRWVSWVLGIQITKIPTPEFSGHFELIPLLNHWDREKKHIHNKIFQIIVTSWFFIPMALSEGSKAIEKKQPSNLLQFKTTAPSFSKILLSGFKKAQATRSKRHQPRSIQLRFDKSWKVSACWTLGAKTTKKRDILRFLLKRFVVWSGEASQKRKTKTKCQMIKWGYLQIQVKVVHNKCFPARHFLWKIGHSEEWSFNIACFRLWCPSI